MTIYLNFDNDIRLELPERACLTMDSKQFIKLIKVVKEYSLLFDSRIIIHTPEGIIESDKEHETIDK